MSRLFVASILDPPGELEQRLETAHRSFLAMYLEPVAGDDDHFLTIPELRPVDVRENQVRGLQFKEKHFKVIGCSSGCLKCRKMQRGERCADGHSQECRKRAI